MVRGPSIKFRLAFYPLLATLFIGVCFFIVLLALGYNIKLNQEKLVLEKTGLIILATKPGDASVYLDGALYKKRTPMFSIFNLRLEKLSLGKHSVKIEKEGYETWEGSFDVTAGKVVWGTYVLMVPQKREKSNFQFPSNVSQVIISPDKTKELIILENKENLTTSFWEINTTNKEKRKIYETRILSGESLRALVYSFDEERILVQKTKDNAKTYLVFENKENPQIWDITDSFKANFDSLAFNPRNHSELFVLKEKNLFNLNFQDKKQSAVLAENVVGIYPDETQGLLLVQKLEDNYGLWHLDQNSERKNIIKSLPASDSYQVLYLKELSVYSILPLKSKDLYLYTVNQSTPILKRVAQNVSFATVSPKSKFLGFATGNDFVVYDIEEEQFFTTLTNRKIDSLAWFSDEYNLIYSENGKVFLVNYNGFYDKYLFDVIREMPVMVGPNSSNIYFGSVNDQKISDMAVFSFNN